MQKFYLRDQMMITRVYSYIVKVEGNLVSNDVLWKGRDTNRIIILQTKFTDSVMV